MVNGSLQLDKSAVGGPQEEHHRMVCACVRVCSAPGYPAEFADASGVDDEHSAVLNWKSTLHMHRTKQIFLMNVMEDFT